LNKKHGMTYTPEWRSWVSMRRRCLSKNADNYAYYGGRGISVCDRWLEFVNFYSDMGPRPIGTTLDRIDNDGDYCPDNCRWADKKTQMNNTTRTNATHCKNGHFRVVGARRCDECNRVYQRDWARQRMSTPEGRAAHNENQKRHLARKAASDARS